MKQIFAAEVTNKVRESRFSMKKFCPHCNHDEASRNGKYHGYYIRKALLLLCHINPTKEVYPRGKYVSFVLCIE